MYFVGRRIVTTVNVSVITRVQIDGTATIETARSQELQQVVAVFFLLTQNKRFILLSLQTA